MSYRRENDLVSALSEMLAVVTAGVPDRLLGRDAVERLIVGAGTLPDVLNGGLECRLASDEDAQVDVQLCIVKGSPDVSTLHTFLEHQATEDGPWRRLQDFVAAWTDPQSPLHKQIIEIWLEFDCKDRLSPPSIFIGLPQASQSVVDLWPAIEAAMKLFLDQDVWDDCKDTVHRCFEACENDVFVSHLGLMLGRQSGLVRVNVKRLEASTISDYLRAVGWSGSADTATATARSILDCVDRITLCLDAGSQIRTDFGLECILAPGSRAPAQWHAAIQRLSGVIVMDPDKASAVTSWDSELRPETSPEPWPRKLIAATLFPGAKIRSQINKRISHLKLSCADGLPMAAKAYLAFDHAWMPIEPVSGSDVGAFYSDDDIALWKKVIGEDLHFHFGHFNGSEDLQTGLRQTVRKYFPDIPKGAKVLDVGCGWGGPASVLEAEHDCQVTGVTVSEAQCDHCRKAGLDVLLCDLDDLSTKLPDGFDIVFSLEMISHIRDKTGFLQRLRPCGRRLIISESCAADDYTGSRATFGGSMYLCTVSELKDALKQAGWTLRSIGNRRPQSMRTVDLWRQNLGQVFDGPPPPGAFAALHSLVENARADPDGWAKSFPLIDIVAD